MEGIWNVYLAPSEVLEANQIGGVFLQGGSCGMEFRNGVHQGFLESVPAQWQELENWENWPPLWILLQFTMQP